MTITGQQLRRLFPSHRSPDALAASLNRILPKYGITTKLRISGFIAQCGHESAGFSVMIENLNYGAQGLNTVFRKYFPTLTEANKYARQPEKIANKVYGNRMGNGPESSGDGFRFRGRGYIQLTGRNNYTEFAKSINRSVDETIAYLSTVDGAIESACWFWQRNNLNAVCDSNDIIRMTRIINGGVIGLEHRRQLFEQAKLIF
jgi:putative chitinase